MSVANSITNEITKAVGGAASGLIQPHLQALAMQARVEIAKATNRQPGQVSDLEVARFFSNLPSADLTQEIAAQGQQFTTAMRNAVLISGGVVALAIVLAALVRK